MAKKRRVLIVDDHQDWLNILAGVFADGDFETQAVQTYPDAICALEDHPFDMTVIDPASGNSDDDSDEYEGRHEGLETVVEILQRFPKTKLVVLSGVFDEAILQNTPEIPTNLPVFDKVEWNPAEFKRMIELVLAGEAWEPAQPERKKIMAEADLSPLGDDGAAYATGLTGPLSTGLIPPPIGSRNGKPRILIVDDNSEWQNKLADLMEGDSYFWRVAATYEAAMERLRLETFHAVLLDLTLGERNVPVREGHGWHLLDYLVGNCPKTRVIILSSEISARDVAKLFTGYPIKGFIDKDNFDTQELMSIIHEQLAGPSLKIRTLGDFRLRRNGKPITNFGDDGAEMVIKILITRHGENVSADELAEFLFPGAEPKSVYGQLGSVINSARLALEPDLPKPGDSSFILRDGINYTFNFLANVDLDTEQLRRLVSEARQRDRQGQVDAAIKDYEAARDIYQGDYLPNDRPYQWALQERSALQGLYTTTLNRLADLYAEKGNLDMAIEAASQSLQVDAYIESTYRRLMRYHYCRGDRDGALAVYRHLVKLFSEFFEEDPDAITRRLLDDILAGRKISCVEVVSASGEWRVA